MSRAPQAIRGVLFDKDGTLIDLHASWVAAGLSTAERLCALAGAPQRLGPLLAEAGYRAADGRLDPRSAWACGSTEGLIRRWMQQLGLAADAELLARMLDHMSRQACLRSRPLADLRGLFARLRDAGMRLGVATMDLERSARSALAALGVSDLLDFVCGCDSGHGEKPAPGMVHAFCAACALAPAQVMVVGDTPHDMHMARSAKAGRAIGVTTGAAPHGLLAPVADRVIADLNELESLLAP